MFADSVDYSYVFADTVDDSYMWLLTLLMTAVCLLTLLMTVICVNYITIAVWHLICETWPLTVVTKEIVRETEFKKENIL